MVDQVDAFRVATGRAEMPREWLELLTDGNEVERVLWQTDEHLRPPPPGE